MAFVQQAKMPGEQTPTAGQPASSSPSETRSAMFSKRSLSQLGLFAAGASFFALTTIITRRSLVRRYRSTIPKFYQPSNRPNVDVNGAVEAFEALSLATINVASISMMAAGGALWAFDISTLDDMRQKIRTSLGVEGEGRDSAADQEMEEWLATVLARKEQKEEARKGNKKDDEE